MKVSMPDFFEKSGQWFLQRWGDLGRGINRYFSTALAGASWIGAAFLKDLVWADDQAPAWWMFCLAGLIVFVGLFSIVLQGRDAGKISELRSENAQIRSALSSFGEDYRLIWNSIFERWVSELRLGADARISVYQHSGKHFMMLGRHSLNNTLAKRGRGYYPDDRGCIGEAWRAPSGVCFYNQFPDPVARPDEYVQAQMNRWRLTDAEARNLTMQPRSIFAVAISEKLHGRRAIVVFESARPRGLNQQQISDFLAAEGAAEINNWLAAMKNQLPTMSLAEGV